MTWPLTRSRSPRVEALEWTGSTNADLVNRIADGESWPHLGVLLTTDQRSGRGRLDRTWSAPAGASLAVSVVLDVSALPQSAIGWLPLLAGTAMQAALAPRIPGHDVAVKWPNDVLVNTGDEWGKISGILATGTSDPDRIVMGSGINVRLEAADSPTPTATSLRMLGAPDDDDDALVADYVAGLDSQLCDLVSAGGDAMRSGLLARCEAVSATLGRRVRALLPAAPDLHGEAVGIAPDGRLRVRDDAATEHLLSAADIVHLR